MIDLHSHLLPRVDDGSRSVEQSVRVLAALDRQGVTALCLTPHLSVADLEPERLADRLETHDRAMAGLMAEAPESPRLHRGVELMLDQPLAGAELSERVRVGGSRYVLVEFPRMLTSQAARGLLLQVLERGLVPVVAHPERYTISTIPTVESWREHGAVIQVDATTIVTNRGNPGQRARALVEAGLADILAADNHGDERSLATAAAFLERSDAGEQAQLLTRDNPAAILDDRALEPVPGVQLKRSWVDWVRSRVMG